MFEVPDRFVILTIDLLEDLDKAEECFKELLPRPNHGFISLRRAVECHLANLQSFRKEFGQEMKLAMQSFRRMGDEQVLDHVVQSLYDHGYDLEKQETLCSKLQTKYSIAVDLVNVKIPMSDRISDFMAGALDPQIDLSYQFFFVGEPDSVKNRESIKLLKDFTTFAVNSTMTDSKSISFSTIQLDGFCSSFCRPEQCKRWCASCGEEAETMLSDQALRSLMPQQASWCEMPQSRLLLSVRNAPPKLIDVEEIKSPSAVALTEVRASGSEIELILGNESNCGESITHLLRISWETKETESGSTRVVFHHKDFEIHSPDGAHIVLDAGRIYSFQVAAVNSVGVGPFSLKRRAVASGRRLASLFGLPVPVVGPLASGSILSLPESEQNRVPSWRCVEVGVALSSDARYEISAAVFSDVDHNHENFSCFANFYSFNKIHCSIPSRRTSVDILWNVEVISNGRRVAELGKLLQEAPSIKSCREIGADYCHSKDPACVKSCEECASRPHVGSPPNCSSKGSYWTWIGTGSVDSGVEKQEMCPVEPQPYWEDRLLSFRRLAGSLSPSRIVNIRLSWVTGCEREVRAARSELPDNCVHEVKSLVHSPIQQLRSKLNSSVVLVGEVWLLVPNVPAFLNDHQPVFGAQLLEQSSFLWNGWLHACKTA